MKTLATANPEMMFVSVLPAVNDEKCANSNIGLLFENTTITCEGDLMSGGQHIFLLIQKTDKSQKQNNAVRCSLSR